MSQVYTIYLVSNIWLTFLPVKMTEMQMNEMNEMLSKAQVPEYIVVW